PRPSPRPPPDPDRINFFIILHLAIRYTSAVVEEDKVWLFAPDLSILCVMNKNTKKIRYVADFGNGREDTFFLYYGIIKAGDCIYAYPCAEKAEELAIYDTLQDKVEFKKIRWGRNDWKRANHKIVAAYVFHDFLYLIGQNLPIIIKINLQNFEQQIFELGITFEMWKNIERIGNKLLIPSRDSRMLVVFDVESDMFELKELPINEEGAVIIKHCGEQLFVVPTDARAIYEINMKKRTINKKYMISDIKEFYYTKYAFYSLFIKKDFVYLFPYETNMIVKINRLTGKAESVWIDSKAKNYRYFNCWEWDENYIAGCYSYNGESFDLYDMETGQLEQYPYAPPENIEKYWIKRRSEGHNEKPDESRLGLRGFIKLILAE
ncbi:MAG: hypothetical protein LUE96_08770, partial [Lachnospiraceae bacterium]|nr:hypothetical protein [Lachnospiraceae bacterium]